MAVLVGKKAPDFCTAAVLENGSIDEKFVLHKYAKGKYVVLFFYPLDFTFVCPSEIIAMNNKIQEFQSRGAVVIGISVDSEFTHVAYRNTPVDKGGIGNISFPLVADLSKSIARDYDVLCDEKVALRGLFIMDKEMVVRHQLVNDLPLGRNVDEAIRILDALDHHEKYGEVCPANWNKGSVAMVATQDGVAEYLRSNADSL